jgi:hypothetical protein
MQGLKQLIACLVMLMKALMKLLNLLSRLPKK